MSHIRYLLVEKIVEDLTLACQTSIVKSDSSRATVVKAYRWQSDPVAAGIYLAVSPGIVGELNAVDGRIDTGKDLENLSLNVPVGEIGGGHLWWRRGTVSIGCYFIISKLDELSSAEIAHVVLGRVESTLDEVRVTGIVDDFGECAYGRVMPFSSSFLQGGGNNQYIWRGEVRWQVLTHRPI